MPYNNTPIAPPKEVSGQVSLPLARVQKIINADPERLHTSKNGAFAIALATEMFIQHLATTTHNVVKAERKPRRNIQYRDVASAVAKTDNLEFLVDVVPKTTTYKEFKKRQEAKQEAAAAAKGKEKEKAARAGAGSSGTSAQNGSIKPATSGPVGPGAISLLNEENVQPETTLQNGRSREPMPGPIQEAEPEAMEVDDAKAQEVVRPEKKDEVSSEPEEDPAAMQIQMEMRGPRTNGSPEIRRTSGFTAINGTK